MKYYITIGIVVTAIALVAYFFPPKTLSEKIISDMVERETKQVMASYEQRLQAYEKEISTLQSSIKDSDKKINKLNKKIGGLENDLTANKPPQDYKEIIVRLNALGFHPTTCVCR